MIIRIRTDGKLPENYLALESAVIVEEKPSITMFDGEAAEAAERLNNLTDRLYDFLSNANEVADSKLQDMVVDVIDAADKNVVAWVETQCEFCVNEPTTNILITGDQKLYSCGDNCYKDFTFICAWCSKLQLPTAERRKMVDYIFDGNGIRTFRYMVCLSCYRETAMTCKYCSSNNITACTTNGALCATCEEVFTKNVS